MSRYIYILLLILVSIRAKGQELDLPEELFEQLSADILESIPETAIPDQYQLEEFRIKNLNKATRTSLMKIPWLTPLQIENLLVHIDQNGPLVSVYELQAIPGWDLSTVRMTAALVHAPEAGLYYDPRSINEQLKYDGGVELQFRMKRRIQWSRGYLDTGNSSFKGGPYYWLCRLRYQKKGAMGIGINMEKDPGERFNWNPGKDLYGADHLSMYLQLENKGPVKKLILGDFGVQWDQGLVMGNGLVFNKQVISGPRKVHQGFLVHSGTREFDFYRGIALELKTGTMEMATMYSYRKLDASVLDPDLDADLPQRVSSIIRTGLHRTQPEIERRKQLPEQMFGLHLRKNFTPNFTASVSGAYGVWKLPLIPEGTRYNSYVFTGKRNVNLSAGIEYLWKNINFFGQFAVSRSRGQAAVAGLIASLSHRVSMTMHVRNYQRDYHGINSGAFGLAGSNINEQGIYWGLQITPSEKWNIGSSTNIFKFPHATFTSDQPSSGTEQLLRFQFIPDKSTYIDLYWRYRNKLVNDNPQVHKLTHGIAEESKHSIGLRAKWQNGDLLTLQSRLQYSRYHITNVRSGGMIVSNQVSYTHKILRFTISMAHFNSDSFETRQYIYEKDLPYGLSIPFFDGIGTRWFCIIQLKPHKKLDIWAKIAQTNYHDRHQVGSGPDVINGSKRTDLSLQIHYKM